METTPTNESPTSRSNLWRRSIVSTSWTFTANLVVFSLILIRAILLARWLPIEVFGIYAMASAVVELSSIMADLGLGEAFLHRAPETEDEDRAAATHLTIKLVLLTSWALLVAVIALVGCRGEMKVAVLVLVGTTMGVHMTQTPRVLLTRRVKHGRLALLRIVTAVVGTGVALGLAAAGATLWALLSVDLVTSGVALAGLYLWRPVWRPRLAWSWARVRYFVGFGGRSFTATLLLRGIERLDDLWTGLYLGDVALGLYSRAFGFATFPRRLIATPVSEVLGGTYAELKGDRQGLSTAFFVSNSTLVRVCFPIAGGMVLAAPELVEVLLGEKWLPMVPAFRLLTVFTLLDPLRYSVAGLFTAVGRPDHAVAARLLQLVVLCLGLTILGPVFGITGVALAVTVTALSGALGMAVLARRYVDVSVVRMMAPPLVGMMAGGSLAVAAGRLGNLPAWAAPWLELVVFGLGYTACLLVLEGRQLRDLIRFAKDLAPTGRPVHRSGSWSVLGRNLLELAHLVGDCAPRILVSGEAYRRLRQLLSRTPHRYELVAERAMPFTDEGWRERKLVSRSTDLCIEAFPGSATSFVSNSVRSAVNRPVNIESHFHQAAQLKRAVSFGVPAIVVVRDPAGACTSLKSKEPRLADFVVLLRWIHYHRWVSRHLDRLEAFLFDELVDDVDLLRRRSPAVASLVAGTIEPRMEFRRASRTRVPIDQSRALSRALLSVAHSVYGRIEAHLSDAVVDGESLSELGGRG